MTEIYNAELTPPTLVLTTLGGLSVQLGQQPISSLFQTKLGALFTYIVFKSLEQPDAPVSRGDLAELFWPQAASSTARTNLRQALRQMKNALGKDQAQALVTTTQAVSWQFNPDFQADFERVEQTAQQFDLLIEQLHLYKGHFLAETALADEATPLGRWIKQTQSRLWHRLLSASASWLQKPLDRSQRDRLKPLLEQLQDLEPTEQSLVIQRAQLKVQCGDKHAAIAFCHQAIVQLANSHPDLDSSELERFTNRLKASLPQPEPQIATSELVLKSERRDVVLVVCVIEPQPLQEVEQQTAAMQEAMAYLDAVFVARRAHSLPLPGGGMLGYFGYPSATENPLAQALNLAWEASDGIKQPVKIQTFIDADLIITGTDTDWPDPAGVLTRRAINNALLIPSKQVGVSEAIVKRCHQQLQGHYYDGAHFILEQPPIALEQTHETARISPLIGRDEEYNRLKHGVASSLKQAVEFMLVKGEPGLGKSHLIQTLINDPDIHNDCNIALIHCREQERGVRLAPLLHSKSPRNEWLVESHNKNLHRDQANRLIDLWVDRVIAQTRQNPVLIVIEDLHWADSATLEWLRRLQVDSQQRNLALVAATRNDFQLPFAISRNQTIELTRLGFEQTLALANALNKPDTQSPWTPIINEKRLNELVKQSDGVPLFLQELIRHAQEQQSITSMPPNLSDFLIARLDTLGKHSGLAQIAATVGRDFDAQILTQITQLRAADLQPSLDVLVEKGFIQRTLKKGSISYHFRHALLQKAAYESQLRSKREQLHANIAEVLFKRGQQESEQIEPQLLACHLMQSGQEGKAVEYWLRAGKKALAEGMQPESVTYYQQAIEQLECIENTVDKNVFAEAVLGLGTAKLAVEGYGSAEVFRLFEQSRALIDKDKQPERYFQCLWGLWHGASSWLGAEDTHLLADELSEWAERLDKRIARIAAHYVQGNSYFWRAHYATALDHQNAALKLAQPGDDDALIAWLGENPIVFAQSFAAWTHWFTGNTEKALTTIRQAERRANGIEHSSSLGFVYIFSAVLGFYQADLPHTRRAAEQALDIARYYNFPLWQIAARTLLNWTAAREGDASAAKAIFEQITAMQQVMSGISCIFQTILLDALTHTESLHDHVDQAYELALSMATDCRDACFLPLIHLINAQYQHRVDQHKVGTDRLALARSEAEKQKADGLNSLMAISRD